jgi:hypothetical protein
MKRLLIALIAFSLIGGNDEFGADQAKAVDIPCERAVKVCEIYRVLQKLRVVKPTPGKQARRIASWQPPELMLGNPNLRDGMSRFQHAHLQNPNKVPNLL